MVYKVTDITYDTDGGDVDLPTELDITVPNDLEDKEEIIEFISDEISNVTGFCHLGFSVPKLDN